MVRTPTGPRGAQEDASELALPGLPVAVRERGHHAHRYAALYRCAGAACHLPCHGPPGHHRGRLGPGAPTPAVSRGLVDWSLPIDQLGAGAKYYQYSPQEARRLLADAGFPKGFKTQLTVTSGLGRDRVGEGELVLG